MLSIPTNFSSLEEPIAPLLPSLLNPTPAPLLGPGGPHLLPLPASPVPPVVLSSASIKQEHDEPCDPATPQPHDEGKGKGKGKLP